MRLPEGPYSVTPRRRSGIGLEFQEALATILASVTALPRTRVPLLDAQGLVLAEELIARDNVPYSDNSAMDGFAVRAEDLKKASSDRPIRLRLLPGLIPAARYTEHAIALGTTIRIMTGAVIPSGCDAVVPQELAEVSGESVEFREPVEIGQHVRRAGEDIRGGAVSLPRGTVLAPAALGVAVISGAAELSVHRRPTVAILTSGDELIGAADPMAPGLVRNANSPVLAALLRDLACDVMDLGAAADDEAAIRERLLLGRRADMLITSGGVSVGEKDLMRSVLDSMGLKVKFWGVNIKPGKPVLFGLLDRAIVFGLPGNPVSTQVAFELFVRPAILTMMGHREVFRAAVAARLETPIRRKPGRPEFYRVRLVSGSGGWTATLTRNEQGSGIASSNLDANGLLFVDGDTVAIPAGETCRCLLLAQPSGAQFAWPGGA